MSHSVSARPDHPTRRAHAHNCLCCGAMYACEGPEETGFCAAVCEPCRWIELGSQLQVYKEVVAAMERKRTRIERRVGKAACHSAYARRNKMKTNANLLVAFGNVISTQIHTPECTNAQGGGSHGE